MHWRDRVAAFPVERAAAFAAEWTDASAVGRVVHVAYAGVAVSVAEMSPVVGLLLD